MRNRRGDWKIGKGVEVQEMRRIYGNREADQAYFYQIVYGCSVERLAQLGRKRTRTSKRTRRRE